MTKLKHRITDNNPIFKSALESHGDWWISDVMYDLTCKGLPLIEICMNLKLQGFLK